MSRPRHTQSDVEQKAQDLLARLGITAPPIEPDEIATRLGAVVRRRANSPDISGLLYQQGDEIIIGVNADDAHVRQRFTVAHEIGHLELHQGDFFVDRAYRAASKHTDVPRDPVQEREANWFAAEILMPEKMVNEQAAALLGRNPMTDEALISALAEKFRVSRQAMGFRVLNLGLINGL